MLHDETLRNCTGYDFVSIVTFGQYFPRVHPPFAKWYVEVTWHDPAEGDQHRAECGTLSDEDNTSWQYSADLTAILAGLRIAQSTGLSRAEVQSVNKTIIDTLNLDLPLWEASGWKKANKKRPACLSQWQEICAIMKTMEVVGRKRGREELDIQSRVEALQSALDAQTTKTWRMRAEAKDPWN